MSVFVPENASEEVRKDVERAREAIGSEIASSSSTSYLRSWRRFTSYCARNEMDFLPAKVDTVIAYFGNLARCNSYSLVLNARAAICHFHKLSFPDSPSPTESNAVGQVVRGLERTIKPAENRKLVLTKQNLHHFLDYLLPNGI